MKKTSILIILSEGLLVAILLMVMITQAWGVSWSNEVLFRSTQGDYVKYHSFDPYCLSIVRQQQTLNGKYIIMISGKGIDDYGHVLNYPDTGFIDEKTIDKTKVLWTAEGVEITFSTGHKLFIPKDSFIKGR